MTPTAETATISNSHQPPRCQCRRFSLAASRARLRQTVADNVMIRRAAFERARSASRHRPTLARVTGARILGIEHAEDAAGVVVPLSVNKTFERHR